MCETNRVLALIQTLDNGITLAELDALDDPALSKAEALLYNWQQLAALKLAQRRNVSVGLGEAETTTG